MAASDVVRKALDDWWDERVERTAGRVIEALRTAGYVLVSESFLDEIGKEVDKAHKRARGKRSQHYHEYAYNTVAVPIAAILAAVNEER